MLVESLIVSNQRQVVEKYFKGERKVQ